MAFRVGQKVVCVNDKIIDRQLAWTPGEIARGSVYEIRWVGRHVRNDGSFFLGVKLVGVDRSHSGQFEDAPFNAARFRPAVERKTDISIFTAMLNPSRENVRA